MNDFEKQLQEDINRLPKSIEPEKELWTGIDIALNTKQSEEGAKNSSKKAVTSVSWNSSWAIAASFVFIAVVGWFGFQAEVLDKSLEPSQLVTLLEDQHKQQKEALLVSFKDVTPLTENWESQLVELDEAATAIKLALKEDPNNRALLKMLQQVYQQQISLIETVYSSKWQKI